MKHKGVVLIAVLVLTVLCAGIAVPIISRGVTLKDNYTENYYKRDAEELAYAGFRFMQQYIVENESDYIKEVEEDDIYDEILKLPYKNEVVETYGEIEVKYISGRDVEVKTKATMDNGKLASVYIESYTTVGGELGKYSDTIYFSDSEVVRAKSVFPSGELWIDKDTGGRDVNGNVTSSEKYVDGVATLKTRMGVDTIPEIDETHLQKIRDNEKTNMVTITVETNSNGVVTQEEIQAAITALGDSGEAGKSKQWQVVDIVNNSKYPTYINLRSDVYKDTPELEGTPGYSNTVLNDRIKTFDLSGFGNGTDRVDLIFMSNHDIYVLPRRLSVNKERFNREWFKDNYPGRTGISGTKFDLINCNLYFIAYADSGQIEEVLGEKPLDMSVYNKDNVDIDNLGQITYVSTADTYKSNNHTYLYMFDSLNTFYYMPNHEVVYTIVSSDLYTSGELPNNLRQMMHWPSIQHEYNYIADSNQNIKNDQLVENAYTRAYGGIVVGGFAVAGLGTENSIYDNARLDGYGAEYYYTEWKGDPWLLGYYE